MASHLVLTVIGDDRPGLVEALSTTIAAHGGNWLESRMASLAGKFAGILRISAPDAAIAELRRALVALESRGLRVVCETGEAARERRRLVQLSLVGADHPGIVREIAAALARRGVNVEELTSCCADAPHSGETLFHAEAYLSLPKSVTLDALRQVLEGVAQDLMVDVSVDDAEEPR